MPTENRSSNTEMVSAKVCGYTPGHAQVELRLCPSGPLPAWLELGEAVVVKPAKQPQGEPIAWMVGSAIWWSKPEAEADSDLVGEPVIPIGPLAGAGEVEQLRLEIEQLKFSLQMHDDASAQDDCVRVENRTLRTQLAERDALFARILGKRDACAASYWFDEIQALLSAGAQSNAVGDGVRDARDYAIEHAGYLADAADHVLADYQAYSLAQMTKEEAGDDGAGEHEEAADSARDELREGLANLRSMVYEFRKRRPRAGNAASAKPPCPICHGTLRVKEPGEDEGDCARCTKVPAKS